MREKKISSDKFLDTLKMEANVHIVDEYGFLDINFWRQIADKLHSNGQ